MKTNIKATNIVISGETSAYLDKKLAVVDKIARDKQVFCEIELGRTTNHHTGGDIFRAEFNCHIQGKDFRAVSETDSLHAAIDEAKDELVSSIKSHKSKQQTLLRRGGATIKNIIKGIYNPFKKSK